MNKPLSDQLEELAGKVRIIETTLDASLKNEKKRKRRQPQGAPQPVNRDPQTLSTR